MGVPAAGVADRVRRQGGGRGVPGPLIHRLPLALPLLLLGACEPPAVALDTRPRR